MRLRSRLAGEIRDPNSWMREGEFLGPQFYSKLKEVVNGLEEVYPVLRETTIKDSGLGERALEAENKHEKLLKELRRLVVGHLEENGLDV